MTQSQKLKLRARGWKHRSLETLITNSPEVGSISLFYTVNSLPDALLWSELTPGALTSFLGETNHDHHSRRYVNTFIY